MPSTPREQFKELGIDNVYKKILILVTMPEMVMDSVRVHNTTIIFDIGDCILDEISAKLQITNLSYGVVPRNLYRILKKYPLSYFKELKNIKPFVDEYIAAIIAIHNLSIERTGETCLA